jgi:uncharacterized phage protein (TIGR02220 family)
MNNGWIKLHRKTLDNPIICKDADHLAVWTYLLLNATHKECDVLFEGKRIKLNPGQLITGRKKIAEKFRIHESKVQRILKLLESEHQIKQRTSSRNRLITINNWHFYQDSEQLFEQQLNNERTTTEHQVNTNKNVKNVKNEINIIVEYLNKKTDKNFKPTTKATKEHISARLGEGFTVEDFKQVIDNKVAAWKDDAKMNAFLRPQTLFNTKFEAYLNEQKPKQNEDYFRRIQRKSGKDAEKPANVID